MCVHVCADPQEGVVVVLPAESQQRLVQLLYFLPKMPQPLLANLSCCCTAGRISASLAASLIRIVHFRWAWKAPVHLYRPHELNVPALLPAANRWQCCTFTVTSCHLFCSRTWWQVLISLSFITDVHLSGTLKMIFSDAQSCLLAFCLFVSLGWCLYKFSVERVSNLDAVVCVCDSLCVMSTAQRELWEAGMQSCHGVLGWRCLHVPAGVHKHTCYSVTLLLNHPCLKKGLNWSWLCLIITNPQDCVHQGENWSEEEWVEREN